MKKLIVSALSTAMVLTMLAGCSGFGSGSQTTPAPSANGDPAVTADYPTAEKPLTIKMGYSSPPNSITDVNFNMYADAVKEATDGAILFELYPNSQLGNEKVLLEGVMSGTVEAAALSANTMATAIPEMNALCLPFLVPTYQDFWNIVTNQEFVDGMNKVLIPNGVEFLTTSTTAARAVTTMKPVRSPDDFKGMKIRVMDGQIYTDIFANFGCGTTVIPFPECYAGLQQGVIDGLDVDLGMSVSMKFFEVAKYQTNINHVFHATCVLINNGIMSKCSPEQQAAIRDCVSVIWDTGLERMEVDFTDKTAQAEDMGVEFVVLTDEEREVFREASQPIYDKYKDIIGEDFYTWYTEFVASKLS